MNRSIERVRLAITAFDEPGRLWQTLGDLIARGFLPEQMCVMAEPGVLRAACNIQPSLLPPERLQKLAVLCAATEEFTQSTPTGPRTFAASSGNLLDVLLLDPSRSPFVVLSPDDDRRLLDELAHSDDVILVVSSNSPSQQLAATRAMLAGSLRRVTTHEYAMATKPRVTSSTGA